MIKRLVFSITAVLLWTATAFAQIQISAGAVTQEAAVTASPVAGTYSSTQTVTLSCTSCTSIFYTTDGSQPYPFAGGTTSLYSSAITVSASETIKAIATRSLYGDSTPASFAYVINIAPSFVQDKFFPTNTTACETTTCALPFTSSVFPPHIMSAPIRV